MNFFIRQRMNRARKFEGSLNRSLTLGFKGKRDFFHIPLTLFQGKVSLLLKRHCFAGGRLEHQAQRGSFIIARA